MISAVIFDMDGVLLDSEPYHDQTTTSILESYGAKGAYEAIRPYVGSPSKILWNFSGRRTCRAFRIPDWSVRRDFPSFWNSAITKGSASQ